MDRQGNRMWVLLQFPTQKYFVYENQDPICPCIKIQNSYDKSLRAKMQLGSYRFSCTNIAVGGGGVFAEKQITAHASDLSLEGVVWQMDKLLSGFDRIVELYKRWAELEFDSCSLARVLARLPTRASEAVGHGILTSGVERVYSAFDIATSHATHSMLSVPSAFNTLERINQGFQQHFSTG